MISKNKSYFLFDVLQQAFTLKYQDEINKNHPMTILTLSYQEMFDYIHHLNQSFPVVDSCNQIVTYDTILSELKHLNGSFNSHIYGIRANMRKETLLYIGDKKKLLLKRNISEKEYEAFYGEEAKDALGIKKEKGKVYRK